VGSRVKATETDFTQGSLQQTGGELDVAIQGQGFFQVLDPNGTTYYTRAGTFAKNASGNLVIGDANTGRLIQPPITIPTDALSIVIGPDGKVSVRQPTNNQLNQVGQIELASFINPGGLLKLGENLYAQTDSSGNPQLNNPNLNGMGSLQQNELEASNVDPVSELINLITTQRSFEMNSQTVKTADEMLQTITSMRRY